MKGHCLCGQVTFEFAGSPIWCGHCHCESCRRATASPFTTWIGVRRDTCRFTGVEPVVRQSSAGARRSFCRNCGSPVAFESERWPEETHLYAALLERPEDVTPRDRLVGEEVPERHCPDDRRDEERLDNRHAPAVERRRLEQHAEDLRDEAHKPDPVAEEPDEPLGLPGRDSRGDGGTLPQRRG